MTQDIKQPYNINSPDDSTSIRSGVIELLQIAIPSSLSMLSFTLMQFVDGLMVARIRPGGPEALSAQFAGGFVSFVLVSFFVGVASIISTFTAQNLGANRPRQCGRYAWAGVYIALAASAILLCVLPAAGWIFSLVGHELPVQKLEVMYFRYMLAMTPALLVAKMLESYFFGLHKAMLVFVVTFASNAVNLAGNYALIFGKFGMPAMGLQGAAISTFAANCLYCVLFFAAFWFGRQARDHGSREYKSVSFSYARDIIRVGWASGLQFFLDMFSWAAAMIFLAAMVKTVGGEAMAAASTIHLTASTVIMRYLHISFMPAVGLGIAASAVVGRHIGRGHLHLAESRAWTAWAMGTFYMAVCGVVFWLFGHQLADLFLRVTDSADAGVVSSQRALIVSVTARLFVVAAVFQAFDATAIVMSGVLKGAGDTVFQMVLSAVGSVVIGFGGGWVMVRFCPQFESAGIWAAGAANVIFVGVAMLLRFVCGHWRKIDLLSGEPEAL